MVHESVCFFMGDGEAGREGVRGAKLRTEEKGEKREN